MHARHSHSRWLVTLCALSAIAGAPPALSSAAAPPAAAHAQAKPSAVVEHWYVVTIGGQKAGWSRDTTTTAATTITRDEEMSFTIRRETQSVTIATHTTFIESVDRRPISMRVVQSMGADPTDTLYEFRPEGVQTTTSTKAGRQSTMLPPIKEAWLTPAAVDELARNNQKAKVPSYSFRSLDPSSGVSVITQTRQELAREVRTIDAKDVDVVRYSITTSAAPGLTMTETVDENGDLLVQETNSGAFTIVITRATKAQAHATFQGPEVMVSLYVVPNRPINKPRSLQQAEFVLSVPDGLRPALVNTGSQHSTELGERSVRVRVNSNTFEPATVTDAEKSAALASTMLADTSDEKILALVARATKNLSNDPPARAEAMRRFVHRFITNKDLSVGFASASETARSAVGDCTEHGVLLAALLRADHIPSRVASGLIYVEHLAHGKGAFGYHLWTQALLTIDGQDRWIDLDATLPDQLSFDAAHIALAISDLSDADTLTSMVSIVPLFGRLTIEVASVGTPKKDLHDAR